MTRAVMLDAGDNVATLIDPAPGGTEVSLIGVGMGTVRLGADIDFGHKLATRPIARGTPILKYGKVIGLATSDIEAGEHVHVHNVEALRGRGDKRAAE